MSSPSTEQAAGADAVILLGRGMPRGEQEQMLEAIARDLVARGVAPVVTPAFLEMTPPGLAFTIDKLIGDGARRIIVVPAFVPWDRNIKRWLPRYLAFQAREHGYKTELVMAQPIESTGGFTDALAQSLAASRNVADVRDAYKPLRRRQGCSVIPEYKQQVYVCLGPRCTAAGAWHNYDVLRQSLRARGLDQPGPQRVMVVRTACQHPCNFAPLMSVQPDNVWYGELDEARVEEIVESHFAGGAALESSAYRAGERVRSPDLEADMKDNYPTVTASHGAITIRDALARPAMAVVDAGAVFMRIENAGATADRLIEVQTPLSNKPRIHDPSVSHGRLEDMDFVPLALAPGGAVELQPGRLHMMLLGLKADLLEGDSFPLRLVFERAGALELNLVYPPAVH